MSSTAQESPLNGLIDLIAEVAVKRLFADSPSHAAAADPETPSLPDTAHLDILPSHPRSPDFPLSLGLMEFRPRMSDFKWGNQTTGDMTSDQGYRIYPAMFEDAWVVIDANKKRLGTYGSLTKALRRAEDRFLSHG